MIGFIVVSPKFILKSGTAKNPRRLIPGNKMTMQVAYTVPQESVIEPIRLKRPFCCLVQVFSDYN
jgi:hypothetical protein